jgi:exopolysaccharide production protein ExoY
MASETFIAPPVHAGENGSALFEFKLKRLFDISLAGVLLIICAPLLVFITLLVVASDGGPALFRQTRVGQGGRLFTCLKFRSMVVDGEAALQAHLAGYPEACSEWRIRQKLTHDPRVTPLGQLLRTTSLDELPQLINVLQGEMSLVGPRPIVPDEVPRYGEHIRAYTAVKPGLTGLWQISGRSNCSYEERVTLDVRYAARHNFALDLLILARTIPAVLLQKGSC